MAKKIILALIILILIIIGLFTFTNIGGDSVDVYLDGENVTVTTNTLSNIDTASLNSDMLSFITLKV